MYPTIDHDTPVGQIARFQPGAMELFERFDIAYACKGGRGLRAAAEASGVDPDELLHELLRLPAPGSQESTAAELVRSIVTDYHRINRRELEAAAALVAGAAQSEKVRRIGRLVEAISGSLGRHMEREELDLFPRIEQLESPSDRLRPGSISRALLVEFVEHDMVAEWLGKVWELALQLTRDEDRDGALFESLAALHRDLNRHMHAENNVLIPMVMDREERNKRAGAGRGELRH